MLIAIKVKLFYMLFSKVISVVFLSDVTSSTKHLAVCIWVGHEPVCVSVATTPWQYQQHTWALGWFHLANISHSYLTGQGLFSLVCT